MTEYWEEYYRDNKIPPWESNSVEKIFKEFIEEMNKGMLLDTGCGLGTDMTYLAEKGFTVIGIDISFLAARRAKNKLNNILQGNTLHLPFENEVFDIINDRGCFHHIKKEDRIIYCKEIHRVLKNRGKIILRFFSEEYFKSGGTGQIICKKDIYETFEPYFKIGEIKDYRGMGNKVPVDMSWCVMEKKSSGQRRQVFQVL